MQQISHFTRVKPFSKCTVTSVKMQKGKNRAKLLVSAVEVDSSLDLIDTNTGLVVSKASALNPVAGFSTEVNGLKWAYRRSQVENGAAKKPKVLLLHGIGSSSYSYRNVLAILGAEGYDAVAPDWLGHGDSDKPLSGSKFDYSAPAFVEGLKSFVKSLSLEGPLAVVTQGFILGQYGLLYALRNEADVSRLLILNTPLGLSTKLRPELAAYQNPVPFLRPGDKRFDAASFNSSGSIYLMEGRDAAVYAKPYDDPAASKAISATMDKVNWRNLLAEIDDGYKAWRKPSLLLFGANDPFVDVSSAFEFLESKRTTMKIATIAAKLGHMPQEDFAEALRDAFVAFLSGETDEWKSGKALKMTKYGVMDS